MGLPWFYVAEPDRVVRLDPEDAAHAVRSLRLRPGDTLTVSDGAGWVAATRLVEASVDRVVGEVIEERREAPPAPALVVRMAAVKGERTSWAVQKLTELGVEGIVLAGSERSVRRVGEASPLLGRMTAVAREAAKQSRRPFLPTVSVADDLLDVQGVGHAVVLWERATDPLRDALPEDPGEVTLVVGPEGGIGDEEARRAERDGAILASLGPQNLRSETAAVAGAALVLSRYGRLG